MLGERSHDPLDKVACARACTPTVEGAASSTAQCEFDSHQAYFSSTHTSEVLIIY
jgi:hypothetical protein